MLLTVCTHLCIYIYIYIYRGLIPGQVISKTQKLVLETSLLNTQYYKVWIKGKWSNLGKGVVPSSTPWCSSYWKDSSDCLRLWLANLYIYIYIYIYAHTFLYTHNHIWIYVIMSNKNFPSQLYIYTGVGHISRATDFFCLGFYIKYNIWQIVQAIKSRVNLKNISKVAFRIGNICNINIYIDTHTMSENNAEPFW